MAFISYWSDEYPHEIHATVILKNNKIKQWKVGNRKLNSDYDVLNLSEKNPDYSYEEKTFTAHNSEEHNEIFVTFAPDWLRQWELHEEFDGFSPFKEHNSEGLPY